MGRKAPHETLAQSVPIEAVGRATVDFREQTIIEQAAQRRHPEEAKALQESITAGLDHYPDFAYHNRAHGLDVVKSTMELVDAIGTLRRRTRDLLVVAAAWHDAGFGDDPHKWQPHGSKEVYAAALYASFADGRMSSNDIAYVQQAIMGTKFDAPRPPEDTAGRLLHLADLDYLSGSWETFLRGALAYKYEEQPQMSWDDFVKLQQSFLSAHQQKEREYLSHMDAPEEMIAARVQAIQTNLERITGCDEQPDMPHAPSSQQLAGVALSLSVHHG